MEELLSTLLRTLKEGSKTDVCDVLHGNLELIPFLLEYAKSRQVYLLHEICCYDYEDIIFLLVHHGADVNEVNKENLTPLEIACTQGCRSVVSFLLNLDNCTLDNFSPTDQTSPYYLATLHGHIEVVQELIDASTDVISERLSDCEVRGVLLYAACLSGKLEMVRLWYQPNVNLNKPIQIVTELTDCENLTPLQAACEADSIDIIEFLLGAGAHLKETIIERYPDLMYSVLKDGIWVGQVNYRKQADADHPEALWTTVVVSLEKRKLHKLHPSWLESHLTCLTSVDISNNHLQTLPSCLPWQTPTLEILNVSNNKLRAFPLSSDGCDLNSLSISDITLSNNKLEEIPCEVFKLPSLTRLDLQNNCIQYLYRTVNIDQELMTAGERFQHFITIQRGTGNNQTCRDWNCPKLTVLNVSRNKLELLSDELLRSCPSLNRLIANNNKLHKFPTPWACELTHLDLCHNQIRTFPTNVAQFWSTSLRTLLMSHNDVNQLPESIVTLNVLEMLDLSHNTISSVASPNVWSCDCLKELNLGYNNLSNLPVDTTSSSPKSPLTRKSKFHPSSTFFDDSSLGLEIPIMMKDRLCYLYLNNNNLRSIPASVFELTKLKALSLKDNPIVIVPNELARLRDCDVIDLTNCPIPQSVIPPALITDAVERAGNLLAFLRLKLRECEKCNRVKLMVLGKERRGKTSLVNALIGTAEVAGTQNQISIREWRIVQKSFWRRQREASEVVMSVWDLPGASQLADIHQCLFTENTLYLLVWDTQDGVDGVKQLSKWFGDIQSRAPSSTILVVGTHRDKLSEDIVQQTMHIEEVTAAMKKHYRKYLSPCLSPIHYVCCLPGALVGISELQQAIHNTALSLKDQDARGFVTGPLIGRQMPKSYLCLQRLLQTEAERRHNTMEPPVLVQGEFDQILNQIPNNDLDTAEEMALAMKFLHDLGDVLHFNDQMRGLNSLYFLDPVWLCDLLSQVIVNKKCHQYISNGIIKKDNLKHLFDQERFPHVHFDQYIQLLERFEITLLLDDKTLLIPCRVSPEKFGSVPSPLSTGEKIFRFYRVSFIPSGFWSRLIAKILVGIPRFTGPNWRVGRPSEKDKLPGLPSKSFHESFCRRSSKGFRMRGVEPIYWQEGIKVSHQGGHFMVESVKWNSQQRDADSQSNAGILITVFSTIGDFSALGFLVDEIDNLVNDWYKGLDGSVSDGSQFALCPDCCAGLASNPYFFAEVNHFSILACAGVCRTSTTITCPVKHNKVPLKKLVPELVLADLPKKLMINGKDLKITIGKNSILGEGAFGCVYMGIYRDESVAVKIFPVSIKELLNGSLTDDTDVTWCGENRTENSEDNQAQTDDSGAGSISSSQRSMSQASDHSWMSHGSVDELNRLETEGLNVYYSLTEVRKEVALLSKLNHPCVLSLMGVCLLPTCLVLEMAPYGNLREVITQTMNSDLHDHVISKIKNKVFPTVFSRKLTYKIIYQIIKALNYLHSNGVIYRDLKPSNVLIWSLDTADPINIKLSDYGISKFSTPQGLAGFCGTPGYQAPETCYGIAYDEKVDIFAFGIVIYEILTGVRPYNNEGTRSVTKAVREGIRPKLQTKDYTVETWLPCFEDLMRTCWRHDAQSRPAAHTILSLMREPSFLCLKQKVNSPSVPCHGHLDCIFLYYSEVKKCELAWLWEGKGRNRTYHIIDTSRGQYVVPAQNSPGPTVTCMTKVNDFMWVGNQSSIIEVFGQRGAGIPECLGKIDTDDVPTCLLYHRIPDPDHKLLHRSPRPSQECVAYVYCGLGNGKLIVYTSYEHSPLLRNKNPNELSWSPLKTLTFNQDKAVTRATLLSKDSELWLACGSIIAVVGVTTLLVEHQISVALPNTGWSETSAITDMVVANNRVWCCCRNSDIILEIDSDTKLPLFVFSCDDPEVDTFISIPIVVHDGKTEKSSKENLGRSELKNPANTSSFGASTPSTKLGSSGKMIEGLSDSSQSPDFGSWEFVQKDISGSALTTTPPPVQPRKPMLPPRLSRVSQGPVIPPRVPPRSSKPVLLGDRSSSVMPGTVKSRTLPRAGDMKETTQHTDLRRQKSRSLMERPSRFSGDFPEQKPAPQSDISLLVVKQTLWVGQADGKITAVSISQPDDHGKVLFNLSHSENNTVDSSEEVVMLNKAGQNSVLSSQKMSNGKTKLFVWEAWGSSEIAEVREYIQKIRHAEVELSRKTSL